MNEKPLTKAIERYFLKEYDVTRMTMAEPTDIRYKRPDLVFVQARRDVLHVIEVESSFSKAFGKNSGFNQLKQYKGNYKWLAIHEDEYYKDVERFERECKKRGIGLIVVSGYERLRVREEIQPNRISGDFLSYYPQVEEEWYES